MPFAALHESGSGPNATDIARRRMSVFWVIAEIAVKGFNEANEPSATSAVEYYP